ncbi:hypothetical protein COV93_06150 [Candidatus Woesearchaeota archaeon CG11_big_fil_rev_8_21_14_0_20_43_8]|nr:MAG: hypothetical protein COV93_06150 [Candidatus Woesearchaeota archaeon CG11_big_fil_rev_8_21_14_0_20_43_8]
MTIEKQYVVPVVEESKETWYTIHGRVRNLSCIVNEHGNLDGCDFARVTKDKVRGSFLFKGVEESKLSDDYI